MLITLVSRIPIFRGVWNIRKVGAGRNFIARSLVPWYTVLPRYHFTAERVPGLLPRSILPLTVSITVFVASVMVFQTPVIIPSIPSHAVSAVDFIASHEVDSVVLIASIVDEIAKLIESITGLMRGQKPGLKLLSVTLLMG